MRAAWPSLIAAMLCACGGAATKDGANSAVQPGQPLTRPSEDLRVLLDQALAARDALRSLQLAGEVEGSGQVLTDEELASLSLLVDSLAGSQLPDPAPGSSGHVLVTLRRALLAWHLGHRAEAGRYVQLAGKQKRLEGNVADVRARIFGQGDVDLGRVAVLLPMSGPHARVGEELWAGLELAHVEAGAEEVATLTRYDTKGTEEGARQAVSAAVRDKSVVAIGPAGRLESRAAAAAAFSQGLPIALLAPESGASNPAAGVFRMVVSPSFEARQAAYVAVELGYRLVAVLAPRDALGREQAAAFAKAARGAGAEVVAIGSYGPDMADLERDFRDFLNLHKLSNERLRRHLRRYGRNSWKSFSPDVDFDLLYLPDGLERGTLAASYLPFFNVELRDREDMSIRALQRKHGDHMPRVVQLLAGSSWIHPSLGARGGAAVEGALVLSTCPGGMGTDLTATGRSFAERFERRNGRAPSRVAAAAYDAMTLVLAARSGARKPAGGRGAMRQALSGARLRDGLCGSLRMSASGQVEGQIEVLRVESGSPEIYEY